MRNEQTQRVDKFLPGFEPKQKKPSAPELPTHRSPQSTEPKPEQKPKPRTSEGNRLVEMFDGVTMTVNFGNRDKWGEAQYHSPRDIKGIYDLTEDETGPALIELNSDAIHIFFTDAVDGMQTLFRIGKAPDTASFTELKNLACG